MAKKDIKISTVVPKYANGAKQEMLAMFFEESYQKLAQRVMNQMLSEHKEGRPVSKYFNKLECQHFGFDGAGRMNRQLLTECSAQVRSMTAKVDKAKGAKKKSKYQKEILQKYNNGTLGNTGFSHIHNHTVDIQITESKTSTYDLWIKVGFTGQHTSYPIKKTRHMRGLEARGYVLKTNALRIEKNGKLGFIYQKQIKQRTEGNTEGVDAGLNRAFTISDGQGESEQMGLAIKALALKQHGSKASASAVRSLKQKLDEEIKKIDFSKIKLLKLERLTGMKIGEQRGRANHHWSYRYILNRIELRCKELGVLIQYINPAYTSQKCSKCGVVNKDSRKGRIYDCASCDNVMDADYNAAINIKRGGSHGRHRSGSEVSYSK